jgi:hypothetical protein
MKLQGKMNRHSAIVKIGLSRQVAIPKKLHDKRAFRQATICGWNWKAIV